MPPSDGPAAPDHLASPPGSSETLFALLHRELHSLASRQLHRQAGAGEEYPRTGEAERLPARLGGSAGHPSF